MHHRRIVGLIVGQALAGGAACSRAAQGSDEDRELVYRSDATLTVRIQTRSQLDATI